MVGIAVMIFDGIAPFIATYLISLTGNPIADLLRHRMRGSQHISRYLFL
jgi:hypothetical protein